MFVAREIKQTLLRKFSEFFLLTLYSQNKFRIQSLKIYLKILLFENGALWTSEGCEI